MNHEPHADRYEAEFSAALGPAEDLAEDDFSPETQGIHSFTDTHARLMGTLIFDKGDDKKLAGAA